MSIKLLTLLVFLAVCLLRSDSFHIDPVEEFTSIQNAKQKGTIISEDSTHKKRGLQAIAISGDDADSIKKEILQVLNDERKKQEVSELSVNSQDSQILRRWSTIFKGIYTIKEYVERLNRYPGGRIQQFLGFSNKQGLIKGLQKVSKQWSKNQGLKEIGITVEKVENKYNALILITNLNLGNSQVELKTYSEEVLKDTGVTGSVNGTQEANVITDSQKVESSAQPTETTASVSESIKTQSENLTNSKSQTNAILSQNQVSPQVEQNSLPPQAVSQPIPVVPSNSIQQKITTNTKAFKQIILYHDLPSVFLNTQNFLLKGRLVSPSLTDDGTTIYILFNRENTNQQERFQGWVPKGATQFEIFLALGNLKQGKYFISAFINFKTFSTAGIFTVRSGSNTLRVQANNAPLVPQNLSVSLNGNDLYILWNPNDRNALVKISFQQKPSLQRQYVLSNFPSKFKVPYKDFYDFKQGQVNVSVSSAYSSSLSEFGRLSDYSSIASLTFKAVQHHFNQSHFNEIQLNSQIPFKIKINDTVTIGGKALNQLSNKIYVLEPGNTFAEYYFNDQNKSDALTVGRTFSKQLTFTNQGVYILQVNNIAGGAVINQPLYVGEGYPLLPDYRDLRPEPRPLKEIADAQPPTLAQKRDLMLKLINLKRAEFGVKPLVGDAQLEKLAQMHSDDMVARNFFGHINPSKQGPQERATRLGITQGVSENIAMNVNVTDGHFSLCRSNAHLMNIVTKEWERVGLGFAWDSEYQLYITQEFVGRDYIKVPLSQAQINAYKAEMIAQMKKLYQSIKSQNVKLSEALKQWQNLSSQVQNSQSILTFLRLKSFRNYSIGNIRISFRQNFIQNMKSTGYLDSEKVNPTEVGIGMKMDNKGWLEIFIAYI